MTPIDVGLSMSSSSAAKAGDIGAPTIYGGGSSGGLLGAVTGSGTKPWYVYAIIGTLAVLGLVVFLKLRHR